MTFQRLLLTLLLSLMALSQLAASCASDNTESSRSGSGSDRYETLDRPRRVPRNADIVRDGTDKLKWTADLDGDVYVYDTSEDRIVYTGPIRRNQELVVAPGDDKIYIEQKVVYNEDLRRSARHQIYFARRGGDSRTTEERPQRDDLPRDSRRLARGTGDLQIDRASSAGTLYIFDEDDRRVLYRRDIKRGDVVQIAPRSGVITLNGRQIDTVRFARDHRHGIYLSDQ